MVNKTSNSDFSDNFFLPNTAAAKPALDITVATVATRTLKDTDLKGKEFSTAQVKSADSPTDSKVQGTAEQFGIIAQDSKKEDVQAKDVKVTTIRGDKSEIQRILKATSKLKELERIAPIDNVKVLNENEIQIVQPLYSDGNLKDAISKPLQEKEKLIIARDVIKALHSLSSKQIAHLAIKPENILLEKALDGSITGAYIDNFDSCYDYEDYKTVFHDLQESALQKDILSAGNVLQELFNDEVTEISPYIKQMISPIPTDRPSIDGLHPLLVKIEAKNNVIGIKASLKETQVSKISESELQILSEFILENRAKYQELAKTQGSVYLRDIGLPRSIQFDADGTVLIHFNKARLGDIILGKGSFKTRVRTGIEFDSKIIRAVGISEIKTPDQRIVAEREAGFFKKLAGKPGISQVIEELNAIGKGGREKSYLTQPLYNKGELFNSVNKLTKKDVCKIALDLLYGFVSLEEEGIIHRDIKLENIFLQKLPDGSFNAFIADLGLACMSDEKNQKEKVACTVPYCDPERMKAFYYRTNGVESATSHKGDMWAFGLVLYALMNKRLAIPNLPTRLTIEYIAELEGDFYPIPIRDSVNPIHRLIHDCLQVDPAQRISGKEALAKYKSSLESLI